MLFTKQMEHPCISYLIRGCGQGFFNVINTSIGIVFDTLI